VYQTDVADFHLFDHKTQDRHSMDRRCNGDRHLFRIRQPGFGVFFYRVNALFAFQFRNIFADNFVRNIGHFFGDKIREPVLPAILLPAYLQETIRQQIALRLGVVRHAAINAMMVGRNQTLWRNKRSGTTTELTMAPIGNSVSLVACRIQF
jgi:hypothetical protein